MGKNRAAGEIEMLTFAWLWMFALLPVPVLVRKLMPKIDSKSASLKVPFFREVAEQSFTTGAPSRLSIILAIIAWLALVTAAARPLWIEESVKVPITGRDLLIALDISGSMQQTDFSVSGGSRFSAVREIAGEFVQRRAGDRVGLILFGSLPYLYAPLTFDVDTVVDFLSGSQVGFAGQRTAIGDTIGLAVKVLRERSAENRILILLTDGENSAGSINPVQAVQLAVQYGVRIFVVGIGPDQALAANSGSSRNILPHIAQDTGGVYFHASNSEALQDIYQQIDQYEPIEADEQRHTKATELYPWPLALSMTMIAVLAFLYAMTGFDRRLFRERKYSANAG